VGTHDIERTLEANCDTRYSNRSEGKDTDSGLGLDSESGNCMNVGGLGE
jgi:hypothetical protein